MENNLPMSSPSSFPVGGFRYPRPFKIRRLGHFGINVKDAALSLRFYRETFGFRLSDPLDFAARVPVDMQGKVGATTGYFLRHGSDHHSFVLFPQAVMNAVYPPPPGVPPATINQVTWQVGSLEEVVRGHEWFSGRGLKVHRAGRDTPGSNWHFYPLDPAGVANELYYGIEQIGWDGYSKPAAMHDKRYMAPPQLPHRAEAAEVEAGMARGVGITDGLRDTEALPQVHDVGGVLLGRPFKVTRVGPVRLFVDDMQQALAFYRDDLGLAVTEEVVWQGERCHFLRTGTEHHSVALYPAALRERLGLRPGTPLLSFGLEVGDHSQLCRARGFLQERGVALRYLPQELTPGMGHNLLALDPDGYALQVYSGMEQVGWDGKPRPAHLRPAITNDHWPQLLEPQPDTFAGEPFLGPLA
jgi:catechol 2,3-dioxygenase-like lactoylglutathione lyase family enzyme